jgi:hypothetical protein
MAKQIEQQVPSPTTGEILQIYVMHNDLILKYHAILWQIPTALLFGNFLTIEKISAKPWPLLALALFDFAMILVFHRLIKQQTSIVKAITIVRGKLSQSFGDMIPKFKPHKITAGHFSVATLLSLWVVFLIYIATLIVRP